MSDGYLSLRHQLGGRANEAERAEKGDPLYALMIETRKMVRRSGFIVWGRWQPGGFLYVHARDEQHARSSYVPEGPPGRTRIVQCAPAVGFLALDDNADTATV